MGSEAAGWLDWGDSAGILSSHANLLPRVGKETAKIPAIPLPRQEKGKKQVGLSGSLGAVQGEALVVGVCILDSSAGALQGFKGM